MRITRIPFTEVPQLSSRDVAYAEQDERLRPFYKYPPTLSAFQEVINDKAQANTDRATLVKALEQQYANLSPHPIVIKQIQALASERTFTVTTAHQPSLFTGPLYYIYKIASTIYLARLLQDHYPDYQFVPVFVSGSEDHDFEEINHTQLFGKTLTWEQDQGGPVGQLPTASLNEVLAELKEILGDSPQASAIYELIAGAYGRHERYGRATLDLVHRMFGDYGLVVLDMSQPMLKRLFVPIMRAELLEQPSQAYIEKAQAELEAAGFSGQAHAREINLFYLTEGRRDRIVREESEYRVLDTDIRFEQAALEAELEAHPERFSPNVILRPLYQELVLPNLAYIGGGGELAYWLERKEQFAHFGINFPMLIRRNSVLWLDRGSLKRMDKLELTAADLFIDTDKLIKQYVKQHTDNELTIAGEKAQFDQIFNSIAEKARSIDSTLAKAIMAEHARQAKALDNLEGRLMRAEKQKHETALNQIRGLQDKLFPANGLQERYDNFLGLYLRQGQTLLDTLVHHLNPLEPGFIIVEEE
ncbi:MAG: bacillithiol biosynthesis cysteine-adding enzyme BshC [Lewinella sp.]|nr:bacillithiol biosynthesis cysteine-adding enzyme BshC [Lewinella sp.]